MSQIAEFQAGVTACLRSWSALKTAVESGWGGGERESQSKAGLMEIFAIDDLRRNILECMDGSSFPPRNMDVHDLADNLAIFLEEEFSVTLEDGSDVQVAHAIFAMYEGCCHGDARLAREMIARSDGALQFSGQFPVQIQTTEHDDDDEMTGSNAGPSNSTQHVNSPGHPIPTIPNDYCETPLFGTRPKVSVRSVLVRQLGEVENPKDQEEMDEDGFATVKRKGRSK